MQEIKELTNTVLESNQPKANAQGQHLQEGLKKSLPSLSTSPEAKKTLAVLLNQCFEVQKLYGKEPENMKTVLQVFVSILGEYEPQAVVDAFRTHLKRSNEFPTPADIVKLIDPEPQPLDKSVYVNLCKRRDNDAENLTHDEWEYLKRYEYEVISGCEKDDLSVAVLQSDNENLRRNLSASRAENARLWDKIHSLEAELHTALTSNKSPQQKESSLKRTIDFMRSLGASDEDVHAAIKSV